MFWVAVYNLGLLLNVVGGCGLFWIVLSYFLSRCGLFWTVVDCCGFLWIAVGHCELFLIVLGRCGLLGIFFSLLCVVVDRFKLFLRLLWIVLGRFG